MGNDKHHGDSLRSFLKKNGISVKELSKAMNISRPTIYELFKEKKFKKKYIQSLCAVLGLTPNFFGLSSTDLESNLKLEKSIEDTPLSLVSEFRKIGDNSYDFFDNYFQEILKNIEHQAVSSFYVLSYLGKNAGIRQKFLGSKYSEYNKKYFYKFQNIIKGKIKQNPHFQYKRIVQLSLIK